MSVLWRNPAVKKCPFDDWCDGSPKALFEHLLKAHHAKVAMYAANQGIDPTVAGWRLVDSARMPPPVPPIERVG